MHDSGSVQGRPSTPRSPDSSGAQSLGGPVGQVDVPGVDAGRQSVHGVIGSLDHLLHGGELHDLLHGAENLRTRSTLGSGKVKSGHRVQKVICRESRTRTTLLLLLFLIVCCLKADTVGCRLSRPVGVACKII